jgi:hypothetical protein
MKHLIAVIAVALLGLSSTPANADEVTKWNDVAARAPLWNDHVYLMTHVAIHDALNTIEPRYSRYALKASVAPGASPEAAVATAAYVVLTDQFHRLTGLGFPSLQQVLDDAYASSIGGVPDGPSKTSGIAVGRAAAAAIVNLRANDGWYEQPLLDSDYPQGTAPGEYRFTPPFNFAFAPKLGRMPPFALQSSHQFRPGAPYAIRTMQYTADFNEVKNLGGDGVTTPSNRTPEQTEIALFWLEGNSSHILNRIARVVSTSRSLNLWENARLLALLNLGVGDSYLACWDTKYHYNYWRPITAIREADSDGNPDTSADKTWTPLVDTPPIPDYDSGHAIAGSAAATVLRNFFGTDNIAFSTCSASLPAGSTCNDPFPVKRSFTSFSQAARENGLSRIYVGFHFRKAVEEGIEHGRKVAEYIFDNYLRPAN